jgi:2-succinyl-5-enolpyruvyl-6-hydroxy-3-cyclohexene-1-carboxylate synthase
LPFSNIWAASIVAPQIPSGSTVHLGILSSLRSWNYFDVAEGVHTASNVGGFGTDGCLSSLIGASLNHSERLYFCVLGDLAFFYDMNVMGNRHVGNNIRILIVNNGKGTEFRRYNAASSYFGDGADKFIAAAEHFGNKSRVLVKNYSENLGFEYLSANNKSEFSDVYTRFVNSEITNKPMVLEIFTDSTDESEAIELINSTVKESKSTLKAGVKKILGQSGIDIVKKIVKK